MKVILKKTILALFLISNLTLADGSKLKVYIEGHIENEPVGVILDCEYGKEEGVKSETGRAVAITITKEDEQYTGTVNVTFADGKWARFSMKETTCTGGMEFQPAPEKRIFCCCFMRPKEWHTYQLTYRGVENSD